MIISEKYQTYLFCRRNSVIAPQTGICLSIKDNCLKYSIQDPSLLSNSNLEPSSKGAGVSFMRTADLGGVIYTCNNVAIKDLKCNVYTCYCCLLFIVYNLLFILFLLYYSTPMTYIVVQLLMCIGQPIITVEL